MEDHLPAPNIFNSFHARRDVLCRTGRLSLAAGLSLTLAGCLEVPDNAFRELSGGAKEIAIQSGRNCWGNQCFTFNARANEVSVAGREPIAVPDGVDLSDDFVSEAEFNQLLQAARSAARVERQKDSDRSSSGDGTSGGR